MVTFLKKLIIWSIVIILLVGLGMAGRSILFETTRPSANSPSPQLSGSSPVHQASVQKSLKYGTFLDAARSGETKDLDVLVKNGADINAQDDNGWTALMYLVSDDNLQGVQALLQHGASVNILAHDGKTTAISLAKKLNDKWFSDTPLVKMLKEALKREEALFDIVKKGTEQDVLKALSMGASPNARNGDEATPLMVAAQKNSSAAVIETLVRAGADVNACDKKGRTALMYAAKSNESAAVIQTLLQLGANVSARDYDGKNAMNLAEKNSPEIREMLMNAGVLRFNNIFMAAKSGTPRDVELLIQAGASVNAQNGSDNSASWGKMTITIVKSGAEFAELLAGEIPGVSTGSAIIRGTAELADNFLGNDKFLGWTPLMFAAEYNSVDMVKALLKFGADINLEAKDGTTALQLAGRRGMRDIMTELRKAGAH